MVQAVLIALLLAVLIAAAAFWMVGRKLQVRAGIPFHARVTYSDTGAWKRQEKPLFSRRYLLTGKPDYMIEEGKKHIPVEVKLNRTDGQPRASDTLQLAAYCLLVEEYLGEAPPYGLLKYRDSIYRVEFTADLRAQVIQVLNEMRGSLGADDIARSHSDSRLCRACGYRDECGQAL